jgi:hypothetical protein
VMLTCGFVQTLRQGSDEKTGLRFGNHLCGSDRVYSDERDKKTFPLFVAFTSLLRCFHRSQ